MPSSPSPARAPWWRAALAPGLMSYLDAGTIITTGTALVLFQGPLGLDALTIGTLSGLLTAALAVGAFLGGRVSDLLGRRRVFLLDLVAYLVGVALFVAAPSAALLYPAVVVTGLAMGVGLPTSLALIAESADEGSKGRMVGLSSALWTVAILTSLGLASVVSRYGATGARILYAHLLVVAVVALLLALGLPESAEWRAAREHGDGAGSPASVPLSALLRREMLLPLLALTGFYTLVNLPANTLGQYMTYLLVNVGGLDAGSAALVGLAGVPFGLGGAVLFLRVADRRSRRVAFVAGAAVQVAAFALPAVAGISGWTVFLCSAGASLGGGFAGEGVYKVWSQEMFPTTYRATAQGVSYGVTRGITALFAVATPTIIAAGAQGLMWLLTAFFAGAALLGGLGVQGMLAARRLEPWRAGTAGAAEVAR